MPRRRKAARPYRKLGSPADLVTRGFDNAWAWVDPERTIQRIATDSGLPEADVLTAFNAIHGSIEQAEQKHMQQRARQRALMLRARLLDWPVDRWSEIFREQSQLENELTPAQLKTWQEWQMAQTARVPASPSMHLITKNKTAPGGARS